MARTSTGTVVEKRDRNGRVISYGIRFWALGERRYMTVGRVADGASRQDAERELAFQLERVRRREWQPFVEPEPVAQVPTFHVFASTWLADREQELRPATLAAYRWALVDHLLPHFHRMRVDAIGVADVDAYRRAKVREARLSASSINATIDRL